MDTGNVVISDVACLCCDQPRGAVYTGPVYAEGERDGPFCPWCIADGSVHRAFDAEFTDAAGVGRGWEPVSDSVIDEVAHRTPGFTGWQQERWFTHCGDATAFLGQADSADLTGRWRSAIPAIQSDSSVSDADWMDLIQRFAKGPTGSPTAYIFECLRCGQLGGYWDSH